MSVHSIYISSVQREFLKERKALKTYILNNSLLSRFFDVMPFEESPSAGINPLASLGDELNRATIYLGIFGREYGAEDKSGLSVTEREFNQALSAGKEMFAYIIGDVDEKRHPKMQALINRALEQFVCSRIRDTEQMKQAVYASLVAYLAKRGEAPDILQKEFESKKAEKALGLTADEDDEAKRTGHFTFEPPTGAWTSRFPAPSGAYPANLEKTYWYSLQKLTEQFPLSDAMKAVLWQSFVDSNWARARKVYKPIGIEAFFLAMLEVGIGEQDFTFSSLLAEITKRLNLNKHDFPRLHEQILLRVDEKSNEDAILGLTSGLTDVFRGAERLCRETASDEWIAARHFLAIIIAQTRSKGLAGFDTALLATTLSDHLDNYVKVDKPGAWEFAVERLKLTGIIRVTETEIDLPSGAWQGSELNLRRSAEKNEVCLRVDAYARVLARLFRLNDPGEFSLAILGYWGRGKTFLMERTAAALQNKEFTAALVAIEATTPDRPPPRAGIVDGSFVTVSFSAWKYPSRPEVWIHLYETVFQALRSNGWWESLPFVIRAGLHRHGVGPLICLWIGLFITAVPKAWLFTAAGNYLFAFEWSTALATVIFASLFFYRFWKTKDVLERTYLNVARHAEKLGLQATIGDDLQALLKGWIAPTATRFYETKRWGFLWAALAVLVAVTFFRAGAAWQVGLILSALLVLPAILLQLAFLTAPPSPVRMLLVVDDLDRCPFDHLLSVVESIKLLIEEPEISQRVRVAILVEEDILRHAIWKKYSHLADTKTSAQIGTRFSAQRILQENLEKLFTAHLRLSALTPAEVSEVVQAFAKVDRSESPASSVFREEKQISSTEISTEIPPKVTINVLNEMKVTPHRDSKTDPTVTLSVDEKRVLQEELISMQQYWKAELGPRTIRAFIFRYQLARLILEELGTPIRRRNEITSLIRSLAARSLSAEAPESDKASIDLPHLAAVVAQVA